MPHASGIRDLDAKKWQRLWRTTPGSDTPRCVKAGHDPDVRSGEFIAGDFVSYRTHLDGSLNESKLWYISLYPPRVMPGQFRDLPLPTIRVQRLDTRTAPILPAQFLNAVWGFDGTFFYPSGTVLPERGRWQISVEQGRNHGCFDVLL